MNDTEGMAEEALRLLVPKNWRFEGGVTWNTDRFPAEAFTSYSVTSPDGAAVFEQFPHVTLFWSDDPMLQQAYAQNGHSVMVPVSAEQALRELYVAEDVTLVISYFVVHVPGLQGTKPAITWTASPTSFRVPVAQMDKLLETFRAIAASRRDNPAWHEHITKLYAGYNHVWSNGSDYVLSDDPAFNPNRESTQTWTEIHPQR